MCVPNTERLEISRASSEQIFLIRGDQGLRARSHDSYGEERHGFMHSTDAWNGGMNPCGAPAISNPGGGSIRDLCHQQLVYAHSVHIDHFDAEEHPLEVIAGLGDVACLVEEEATDRIYRHFTGQAGFT